MRPATGNRTKSALRIDGAARRQQNTLPSSNDEAIKTNPRGTLQEQITRLKERQFEFDSSTGEDARRSIVVTC